MTVKSAFIVVAAAITLTACGTPVQHMTASGKVEEIFRAPPEAVKPQILGLMANNGFNVTKDTPYLMAFDKPSENMLANVLLGSKYDATPNVRITYSFVPQPYQTRVIADVSLVTNPGSAFEKITPMNANESTAKLQGWLDDLSMRMTPPPPPPPAN